MSVAMRLRLTWGTRWSQIQEVLVTSASMVPLARRARMVWPGAVELASRSRVPSEE